MYNISRYVSKYISSFVGFAPAINPKIIVGVMVDEPKKISYYGGIVAAPVFSGIVSEILPLYNVPKDRNLDKVEKSNTVNIENQTTVGN